MEEAKKIPIQKLLIHGDRGIGKSSLSTRYYENTFGTDNNYFGIEFRSKRQKNGETEIKLYVWDTPAGRDRFRHITSSYYRGAHGILLCFDLTNESSFNSLEFWFSEIEKYAPKDVSIMLIGLKADLLDKREVDEDRIQLFAVEKGVEYVETSSKTGENVHETIDGFVDQLILKNRGTFNQFTNDYKLVAETPQENTCTIL